MGCLGYYRNPVCKPGWPADGSVVRRAWVLTGPPAPGASAPLEDFEFEEWTTRQETGLVPRKDGPRGWGAGRGVSHRSALEVFLMSGEGV